MKLKILIGYMVAAALGATLAVPVFAQSAGTERKLQNWIDRDPRLQADPGLMNDPTYLRNHPNFATWLQQHPAAHKQVKEMGAYDRNHQWRNTDWWHHNDPDTMYKEHPEWVKNHPEWRKDGDWDDQQHWHDRSWWQSNHKNWVQKHHPEWAQAQEQHQEHRETRREKIHEKVEKWEKHHEHNHSNSQDQAHHQGNS